MPRDHSHGAARALTAWLTLSRLAMTFPWEVPEKTVVVEFDEGFWRVVPHRGAVRTFNTREEALDWAQTIVASFLDPWHIIEKPPASQSRRVPA